ncbi:hypothetical protein [Shewanella oncorhynchi]|uniref:hypothetical protein n=1 Tax=Shewanella oncorhynchi TaxID=2726434 RepID=UPI003D7AF4F1
MYFIAAFGLLMLLLSLVMAVKPESFSKGIISFSEQPYFHIAELFSRVIAGLIFTHYSTDTQFPQTIFAIGIVLLGVGMGLALTPPRLHRKFALWSAQYFNNKFRLIGLFSIPLSLLLIYCAVGA